MVVGEPLFFVRSHLIDAAFAILGLDPGFNLFPSACLTVCSIPFLVRKAPFVLNAKVRC